jgi:hypothetical protein
MRFTALVLFLSVLARGQNDTLLPLPRLPLVGVHLSGQVPFGDLAKRFGPSLGVGGTFLFKTRHNWLVGAEGNYFFGRNVKEDVLSNLKNADGFITDNEGYPADLRVTERAICVQLLGGKVFDVLSANRHSGLMVLLGAGVMQHRVKFYDRQSKVAALAGDLKAGYDRLSLGFSLSQFVGYLFLSEHRMVNFYTGFEFFEGFTKSLRKFNYDTGQPDTSPRFDGLVGFRFGWILPLYKKKPDEFYYY